MIIEFLEFSIGLVIGGGAFIGGAYLVGGALSPKMATSFGRVMWTMAAMVNRASVLEYTHGVGYAIRPMRMKSDNSWEMWKDDKWEPILTGNENVSRLGKRPFGIVMKKEKQAFSALIESRVPSTNVGDGESLSFGHKAGLLAFIPQRWNMRKDGWLISIFTLASRLKLGASSDIANRSWNEALQEYADSGFQKFSIAHAIFYLACLSIGVLFAWFMFGGKI